MNPEYSEMLLGSLEVPEYLLPNTVEIKMPKEDTREPNTMAPERDYIPLDERNDEPCSIQGTPGVNVIQFEQQIVEITHTIYFQRDPMLRPGYIVVDKDDGAVYLFPKASEPANIGGLYVAQVVKQEQAEHAG